VTARAAQLEAQGLVEADRGVLAGAVVDELRGADETGGGRDRDDVAAVALEHRRQEGARRPEEGERVHRERALDVAVGRVEERLPRHDAGVVHEDVDRPAVGERARRDGGDRGAVAQVADVGRDGRAARAELRARRLQACGVDVPEHEPSALGGHRA